MTVTHKFVSAIPDDPAAVAAGEVVPSNWNDTHNVAIGIADLTATGTPSSTTFLRGDNTWSVPSSSGGSGGRKAISTPVTMLDSDNIVGVQLTVPGAVAIAGASGRTPFKPYIIKDQTGDAASNNITYTPNSGTIDGMASILIQQNYDSLTIYSDGTNEFTM